MYERPLRVPRFVWPRPAALAWPCCGGISHVADRAEHLAPAAQFRGKCQGSSRSVLITLAFWVTAGVMRMRPHHGGITPA